MAKSNLRVFAVLSAPPDQKKQTKRFKPLPVFSGAKMAREYLAGKLKPVAQSQESEPDLSG